MSNIVIILSHLREGRLLPLGVSSSGPSRSLPQVPSFASQDFPGFEALIYWVMLGPAGIPPAINARMQEALRQTLSEAGVDIVGSTPAESGAFIRSEITNRGEVIRANNIRRDN